MSQRRRWGKRDTQMEQLGKSTGPGWPGLPLIRLGWIDREARSGGVGCLWQDPRQAPPLWEWFLEARAWDVLVFWSIFIVFKARSVP